MLLKNGVPASAIIGENQSGHTCDNAFFSRKAADERGVAIKDVYKRQPLSVQKKKDGITYIMMTDGAQDHLFTLKDGAFIRTDMISYSCWNDESMTPEALQEKIDSYETILYVDYSTPDQYDGPNLLADTQKTIESLQELAK